MTVRVAMMAGAFILIAPALVAGQNRAWVAELAIGYAGFVDEATKSYLLAGGGVRRFVTSRLSIGAELTTMSNAQLLRDRNLMVTGNVVLDLRAPGGARRVTTFVVGGVGKFWGRDIVRGGPYWSSDPAFTAGAGIRTRVTDRVYATAEYRVGWELHQRLSASAGFDW